MPAMLLFVPPPSDSRSRQSVGRSVGIGRTPRRVKNLLQVCNMVGTICSHCKNELADISSGGGCLAQAFSISPCRAAARTFIFHKVILTSRIQHLWLAGLSRTPIFTPIMSAGTILKNITNNLIKHLTGVKNTVRYGCLRKTERNETKNDYSRTTQGRKRSTSNSN